MSKPTEKLTVPSVLAFERKLDVSDAVFTQKDSQNPNSQITSVPVQENHCVAPLAIVKKMLLQMTLLN